MPRWRPRSTRWPRELGELETLKCAIEARQARLALAIDESVRREATAAGVPAERQGRGVAEQVALARRVSPHRGRQLLGLAKSLTEMPHTMAAFRQGQVSEWRTTLLARETACLERRDRLVIDAELAEVIGQLGDRELAGRARARAAELDAASVARRRARAEADRCVTIRPVPDSMVYLTALLPMAQGVAVYASLKRAADTAVGTGQATSRNQVMADTLVGRVTGHTAPDGIATEPISHPVHLNLVMTDATLLAGHTSAGNESAWLTGVGHIPTGLARELLADGLDHDHQVTLRRLYTRPATGELVGLESARRLFPARLAEFIQLRDRYCRAPYCGAPIRHIDHVKPYAEGGRTTAINGQGLCEQCNHAKQGSFRPPPTAPPPLHRPRPRARPVVIEIHHPAVDLAYEPIAS